ncbi:NAD-dependent epimerase/dehydratase family protein [Candidatus Pelagibacter sp.]|nr:NAD-dependent epimerase/dehydratase family protein [Candidatus Pelagibacter sp.]
MKIIVTGAAGFIGFHLIKKLIQKRNIQVLGIDSVNNYYSTKVKKFRIKILSKNKKFFFERANLQNKKKTESILKSFLPDAVYHMAGQPGVLYSFKDPISYKKNNIEATKNLSILCKKYNVKKFIFASSSSVYGDQKKFPILEKAKTNPKNYYAKTKLSCEKIIKTTFMKSNTEFMIFRFFTVFGPLGRPDMFIHKFLNSIKNKKKIFLHNNGLNYRDFTYIDDLIKILILTLKKFPKDKLLNICRSKPIKTNNLLNLITKIYGNNTNKIVNTGFVKGEMLKTHGSNSLLKKNFKNLKFTNLDFGLKKTITAYKKYNF